MKILYAFSFLMWSSGSVLAESPGVLRLHSGENEIPIVLHNQTLRSITNLDVELGSGSPDWVTVRSESIALIPDNSQDHHITEFNLHLFVNDSAEHPDTIIPLILTDDFGRTWEIQLHVEVLYGDHKRSVLLGNFPNPFNPSTIIRYRLDNSKPVPTTLIVYDSLGQSIRTLVSDLQSSGLYEVQWDGRDDQGRSSASGVYHYVLKSGKFEQVRSMTLIH